MKTGIVNKFGFVRTCTDKRRFAETGTVVKFSGTNFMMNHFYRKGNRKQSAGNRGKAGRFSLRVFAGALASLFLMSAAVLPVSANEFEDARKERMNEVVLTNTIADWPQGPIIGAEGAILMEARTGAILYAKNIDEKLFPASTTKIMTGLLAYENCKLDEDVEFSYDAVHSVSREDSNIGMDAGEIIPMNKALEGMMILSANEVANAIAEHISGTTDDFAELMNKKAAEIGCTNTHFSNPNGLHDDNHYTTPRDLALIAKYYFSYDYLASLSREPSCEFTATETQPDDFVRNTKNMLVKGKKYEYEYLVGSKTGYTSVARQTLVSAAKKDGMELICVIMKEESPFQYEDTVALFDYGFENFKKVSIADHAEESNMLSTGFFSVGQDVFGSNKSILNIDPSAVLILPKNAEFSEVNYDLTANNTGEAGSVAKISYLFHGNPVGEAALNMSAESPSLFEEFSKKEEPAADSSENSEGEAGKEGTDAGRAEEGSETGSEGGDGAEAGSGNAPGDNTDPGKTGEDSSEEVKPVTNRNKNGIFINVKIALISLGAIVGTAVLLLVIRSVIRGYQFSRRRKDAMERHRKRKRSRRERDDDYID